MRLEEPEYPRKTDAWKAKNKFTNLKVYMNEWKANEDIGRRKNTLKGATRCRKSDMCKD